jgi:hypothetical protein
MQQSGNVPGSSNNNLADSSGSSEDLITAVLDHLRQRESETAARLLELQQALSNLTSNSSCLSQARKPIIRSQQPDALVGGEAGETVGTSAKLSTEDDASPTNKYNFNTSRSLWHPNILKTANKAEALLRAQGITRASRSSRLFIPLLTSRPEQTCCSLKTYQNNVVRGLNNTSDFFVFSINNTAEASFRASAHCKDFKPAGALLFFAVDEYWSVPKGSVEQMVGWNGYNLMGHWRLAFQNNFADILGYRWASLYLQAIVSVWFVQCWVCVLCTMLKFNLLLANQAIHHPIQL